MTSKKHEPFTPDLVGFGAVLVKVMRSRGISQAALGDLIGRSQKAVSDWVTGKAEPPASMVFEVERYLDLAPGALGRHLGYVPVSLLEAVPSVEQALIADETLDEPTRRVLLAAYAEYQRARGEVLDGASIKRHQQADERRAQHKGVRKARTLRAT